MLWLLKAREDSDEAARIWSWYDVAHGFVARAPTEVAARAYAAGSAGREGADAWENPALTECTALTQRGPRGVILRDFLRG